MSGAGGLTYVEVGDGETLREVMERTPPLCAAGFIVIRMIMAQGREIIDEEGCGLVFAGMRWPASGVGDFN